MKPNIRLDRNIIGVHVDQVVHLMLELTAPDAPPTGRAPIDLVLVLDRSGSMSGDPLRAVREAAARVIRTMGPDDRVAVVAFDDEVSLVLPLARHIGSAESATAVRQIRSGGSTNLSGGWLKGFELLGSNPRPEAVRRIVLLTDGHANAGLRSIDELGPIVRDACGQGITTSCIGFGEGHDERFLAGLADSGGGDDYWCEGPDQANAVFANELGLLAAVVAQNLSVEIRPTAMVAACEVLNEFPITEVQGGVQVSLGDAVGGEQRRVLSKMHLRPAASLGDVHVADLVIRWVSTVGDLEMHTVTVPVRITAGDGQVVLDEGVAEEIVRLGVARERREAQEAADRGDFSAAAGLLRSSAVMARGFASLSADADLLDAQAIRMEQGDWSESDKKRSYIESRRLHKGRKKEFSAYTEPSEPSQPSDPSQQDPDDQSPS